MSGQAAPFVLVPSKYSNYYFRLLVVVCLVMLAEFVGLLQPVRQVSQLVLRPLESAGLLVVRGVAWPVESVRSGMTTKRRIQDLELRYAESLAQLGELDALRAENESLRTLVGASQTPRQSQVVTFPVISYGRPLVAAGELEGVREGQLVLVAQTMVGRIKSTTERQAEVTLLTQADAKPVVATTENGIQGIIAGDGRRVLLKELPSDADVQVGQRVVTQGQEGIPPHLHIGKIAALITQPAAATQVAVIEQYVSFYEASLVEIR